MELLFVALFLADAGLIGYVGVKLIADGPTDGGDYSGGAG
jgi:hypothetical protein